MISPAAHIRVTAIFATMNRAKTAEACVLALARQTQPPDCVMVADNVSSDDTVEVLERLVDLPFKLLVHRMPGNQGNAGGVRAVMEMAFAEGADAVWILDDDSWPREKALEGLLEGKWDPQVVRHALQVDPKTGRFTWPLQIDDQNGGWRLVWDDLDFPEGRGVRSRITWTGALLPRKVWEVVGPVNGELFIRGEDEEYPWRIEQAGFFQEAIRGAVMDHPGPDNLVQWQFLGKNFFFERGLADWKLYYKVRNMVWLKRRQSGRSRAVAIALAYTVACVLLDGPHRFPLLCKAVRHGWIGRLGRL